MKISTAALRDMVTDYRLTEARQQPVATDATGRPASRAFEFEGVRAEVKAMSYTQLCNFATKANVIALDVQVGMSHGEANDLMQLIVDEFGTVKALSMLASSISYVVTNYPDDMEASNFAKRIITLSDEIDDEAIEPLDEQDDDDTLPKKASEYDPNYYGHTGGGE
jgi:hypothetical protein